MKIFCPNYDKANRDLAEQLGIELTARISNSETYLSITKQGLVIINKDISEKPIRLDFNETLRKFQRQNLKKHPLVTAVGIKNKNNLIIDTTAGFAKDSLLLASLGHKVISLESSPIIFYLIQEAKNRLLTDKPNINLDFLNIDSFEYLTNCKTIPDIIYIDPMFPESSKSALAKKNMQILQKITKTEKFDYEKLLKVAIKKARKKVIVKRPRLGPFLAEIEAKAQISSNQSTRYDIYY